MSQLRTRCRWGRLGQVLTTACLLSSALACYLLVQHAATPNTRPFVKTQDGWGLGLLSSGTPTGWTSVACNTSARFRLATLPTAHRGNLSMYVYDSFIDDLSTTAWVLKGQLPEAEEIEKFLEASGDLPVIDVGANLGSVALQAAMMGRAVVALEPVPSSAHRLCRSALDFSLDPYLHVLLNAASSQEGEVTLAADFFLEMARYSVQGGASRPPGFDPVTSYAIQLDRLLDIVPFAVAALKIDVEAHEGHVLAGAERLFQEMDIPIVWLEWEHVKGQSQHGAMFILDFMRRHSMTAYDIISGKTLNELEFKNWPATVLWRKKTKVVL